MSSVAEKPGTATASLVAWSQENPEAPESAIPRRSQVSRKKADFPAPARVGVLLLRFLHERILQENKEEIAEQGFRLACDATHDISNSKVKNSSPSVGTACRKPHHPQHICAPSLCRGTVRNQPCNEVSVSGHKGFGMTNVATH